MALGSEPWGHSVGIGLALDDERYPRMFDSHTPPPRNPQRRDEPMPPFGNHATIVPGSAFLKIATFGSWGRVSLEEDVQRLPGGLFDGLVGIVPWKHNWTEAQLAEWGDARTGKCLVMFRNRGQFMLSREYLRYSGANERGWRFQTRVQFPHWYR